MNWKWKNAIQRQLHRRKRIDLKIYVESKVHLSNLSFDFRREFRPNCSISNLTYSAQNVISASTHWDDKNKTTLDYTNRMEKICLRKPTIDCFFNQCFDKGRLRNFVLWFLKIYGENKTVLLVEQLKNIGFEYASKAGISLGIEDLKIPPRKYELIFEAEEQARNTLEQYSRGAITGVERFQRLIDTWHRTSENLKQEVVDYFEITDVLNPVYMMAFSGARGNISQVRQLVGMRGLMADPQGQIIDFPIRSNFREGLTLTEYFISSYGARKGIVDTALRTANAGYLTRRLVDVAQHVIISNFDCGTYRGIFLKDMKEGNKTIHSLLQRLVGRVLARDLIDISSNVPNKTFLARRNQEIPFDLGFRIAQKFDKVFVRSPLTCETNQLICQLCYGWSLGQGTQLVSIGEAVGVIAAQSIGEPGTQLTMRTFHTGGVFSGDMSEQVRAPFNGIVTYEIAIPGVLIRTPEGKIAFLTKSDGFLKINSFPLRQNVQYKIPSYTVLYIRNGQFIEEKTVIAQITTISRNSNKTDTAELTIYSLYEGQFYSQNLAFQERLVGAATSSFGEKRSRKSNTPISQLSLDQNHHNNPFDKLTTYSKNKKISSLNKFSSPTISDNSRFDTFFEAWTWGYVWILSGKIYEFNLSGESCFPFFGDLVNQKSSMNQTQWNFNLNCGTAKFEYGYNISSLSPLLLGQKQKLQNETATLLSNLSITQELFYSNFYKIRFRKLGYIFEPAQLQSISTNVKLLAQFKSLSNQNPILMHYLPLTPQVKINTVIGIEKQFTFPPFFKAIKPAVLISRFLTVNKPKISKKALFQINKNPYTRLKHLFISNRPYNSSTIKHKNSVYEIPLPLIKNYNKQFVPSFLKNFYMRTRALKQEATLAVASSRAINFVPKINNYSLTSQILVKNLLPPLTVNNVVSKLKNQIFRHYLQKVNKAVINKTTLRALFHHKQSKGDHFFVSGGIKREGLNWTNNLLLFPKMEKESSQNRKTTFQTKKIVLFSSIHSIKNSSNFQTEGFRNWLGIKPFENPFCWKNQVATYERFFLGSIANDLSSVNFAQSRTNLCFPFDFNAKVTDKNHLDWQYPKLELTKIFDDAIYEHFPQISFSELNDVISVTEYTMLWRPFYSPFSVFCPTLSKMKFPFDFLNTRHLIDNYNCIEPPRESQLFSLIENKLRFRYNTTVGTSLKSFIFKNHSTKKQLFYHYQTLKRFLKIKSSKLATKTPQQTSTYLQFFDTQKQDTKPLITDQKLFLSFPQRVLNPRSNPEEIRGSHITSHGQILHKKHLQDFDSKTVLANSVSSLYSFCYLLSCLQRQTQKQVFGKTSANAPLLFGVSGLFPYSLVVNEEVTVEADQLNDSNPSKNQSLYIVSNSIKRQFQLFQKSLFPFLKRSLATLSIISKSLFFVQFRELLTYHKHKFYFFQDRFFDMSLKTRRVFERNKSTILEASLNNIDLSQLTKQKLVQIKYHLLNKRNTTDAFVPIKFQNSLDYFFERRWWKFQQNFMKTNLSVNKKKGWIYITENPFNYFEYHKKFIQTGLQTILKTDFSQSMYCELTPILRINPLNFCRYSLFDKFELPSVLRRLLITQNSQSRFFFVHSWGTSFYEILVNSIHNKPLDVKFTDGLKTKQLAFMLQPVQEYCKPNKLQVKQLVYESHASSNRDLGNGSLSCLQFQQSLITSQKNKQNQCLLPKRLNQFTVKQKNNLVRVLVYSNSLLDKNNFIKTSQNKQRTTPKPVPKFPTTDIRIMDTVSNKKYVVSYSNSFCLDQFVTYFCCSFHEDRVHNSSNFEEHSSKNLKSFLKSVKSNQKLHTNQFSNQLFVSKWLNFKRRHDKFKQNKWILSNQNAVSHLFMFRRIRWFFKHYQSPSINQLDFPLFVVSSMHSMGKDFLFKQQKIQIANTGLSIFDSSDYCQYLHSFQSTKTNIKSSLLPKFSQNPLEFGESKKQKKDRKLTNSYATSKSISQKNISNFKQGTLERASSFTKNISVFLTLYINYYSFLNQYKNINNQYQRYLKSINHYSMLPKNNCRNYMAFSLLSRVFETPSLLISYCTPYQNPLTVFPHLNLSETSVLNSTKLLAKNKNYFFLKSNRSSFPLLQNSSGFEPFGSKQKFFKPKQNFKLFNSSYSPKPGLASTCFLHTYQNLFSLQPLAKTNLFSPFYGEMGFQKDQEACLVITKQNLVSYYLSLPVVKASSCYSIKDVLLQVHSINSFYKANTSTKSFLQQNTNNQKIVSNSVKSASPSPKTPSNSTIYVTNPFVRFGANQMFMLLYNVPRLIKTSNSFLSSQSFLPYQAITMDLRRNYVIDRPQYSINNIFTQFLNMTDSGKATDSIQHTTCVQTEGFRNPLGVKPPMCSDSLSLNSAISHEVSYINKTQTSIYKISDVKAGNSCYLDLRIQLGGFSFYGDPISSRTAMQTSGQIVHYSLNKITLRRSQPISVSPKGILHKFDNDFIDLKTPVITLSYQKLKTGDIIQGIPKVEQFFEARTTKRGRFFRESLPYILKSLFQRYKTQLPLNLAVRQSFYKIQHILVDGVHRVYKSQGVTISDKHIEVVVKQMTSKVRIIDGAQTGFFPGETVDFHFIDKVNSVLMKKITYEPLVLGITKASLEVDSFLSASSFQQTTKVLSRAALFHKKDFLKGLKQNVILGNLIPAGTGFLVYIDI